MNEGVGLYVYGCVWVSDRKKEGHIFILKESEQTIH